MLKPFCDMCDKSCSHDGTQTRRFERLAGSEDGEKSIGIDIVFIFDGVYASDRHVCNSCMFKLVLAMAKSHPESVLAVQLGTIAKRDEQGKSRTAQLSVLEVELNARESRVKESEARFADFDKQLIERDVKVEAASEEVKQLKQQLGIAIRREAEVVKRMTAEFQQRIRDMKDYPEYVESTNKREKLRRTGVN